jgi:hypothetical protein
MDERGANIDIVFRNGLKDFEVLPPPEVWDNIYPAIKRKQRPFIVLRAAALIALVLSISFLTYRMSREILTGPDSTVMALNGEPASPGISDLIGKPLNVAGKENNPLKSFPKTLIENIPKNDIIPENEKSTSPDVAYLQETNSLLMNDINPLHGPLLASLNSSQGITFKTNEIDQQYITGNSTIRATDRWSLAAMASPTYYSKFNTGNSDISKQLMASEQPLISYSGGVALSYKVNKRFSVQSGVYYSSLGQEVDGISSFGGFNQYNVTKGDERNFEVLTSGGTIYTTNTDVFLIATGDVPRVMTSYTNDVFDPEKASLKPLGNTIRQNFSYLEFPIVIRYKLIDKVIDFNLIGGVSTNMLVNNSAYTMVDGGRYSFGETDGLNLISLSSSLGMGMEYNISDNFALNVEPTFRYYLNPGNGLAGSKIHPYSFGIFSGVSYKF